MSVLKYKNPITGEFEYLHIIGGIGGSVSTDKTLTESNKPADAKTVGDRLNALEQLIGGVKDGNGVMY